VLLIFRARENATAPLIRLPVKRPKEPWQPRDQAAETFVSNGKYREMQSENCA
jgi:hypothetical protein